MGHAVATGSAQVARRRRGRENVRDMVLSLSLVLGVVFAAYAFFTSDPGPRPPEDTSVTVKLGAAQRAASYPVLEPVGLASGWGATSSRLTGLDGGPVTLHIGYLTPDNEYAGLEQSNRPAGEFVAEVTRKAVPQGRVDVAGAAWQVLHEPRSGDNALVRTDGERTVVIVGSATLAQLQELAGALQPVPAAR